MKLYLLVLITICWSFGHVLSQKCPKVECSATEYQNYVDCIRGRMKRSADCVESEESDCSSNQCESSSCEECDCNECTSPDCGRSCNRKCCSSCCEFKECSTNHCCHKVCHSSCKTSSCRNSCRKTCYKSVKGSSSSKSQSSIKNKAAHNVTTVIHLNNLINNTNYIDVPINLNNSNVNDIVVESSNNGTTSSNGSTPCCSVVEPRQCVSTPVYPYIDCFHYRRQQCGQFCQSPVVHKVSQNVCYNGGSTVPTCGQQIIYVPQPQPQPSCSYTAQWPFVSCTNQATTCNGCYDYLLNPYRVQSSCSSSCYNYGQASGYGQGPFLGPLPSPPINPAVPPGCGGYGGCGLTNMANYINPGMYYGANPYANYGVYGNYIPYDPAVGGLPNINGFIDQFIPANITSTNSSKIIYGSLDGNSTLANGDIYNKPIAIDEETFKKILEKTDGKIKAQSDDGEVFNLPSTTIEDVVTTKPSFSLFGR